MRVRGIADVVQKTTRNRPATPEEEQVERYIGGRIREARREKGVSQLVLSERIGVDRATIAKYEKGQARLLFVRLLAIAVALSKPISYFVCEMPIDAFRPDECPGD